MMFFGIDGTADEEADFFSEMSTVYQEALSEIYDTMVSEKMSAGDKFSFIMSIFESNKAATIAVLEKYQDIITVVSADDDDDDDDVVN